MPFCYLASKFNHKISLFKRQKASYFRKGLMNLISEKKEKEKEELEEELRKTKKRN
jgi:hypothetical protein